MTSGSDNTTSPHNNAEKIRSSISTSGEALVDHDLVLPLRIAKLYRITATLILALILLMPIVFGSVHRTVYLPIYALVFFLVGAHSLIAPRQLFSALKDCKLSSYCLILLFVFLGYSLTHYYVKEFFEITHPVLSVTGSNLSQDHFWGTFFSVLFFTCTFLLTRLVLTHVPDFSKKLPLYLIISGFIVSMIGLSHWFRDNGKLLWLFEPEYVFVSDRARWPFVNSNHLAHFLLPVFFLLLARLISELISLSTQKFRNSPIQDINFSRLIVIPAFQTLFIRICFITVLLISAVLCISATLSRSSWFSLSLTIVLFLVTERFFNARNKSVSNDSQPENNTDSRIQDVNNSDEDNSNKKRHKHRKGFRRNSRSFGQNINPIPGEHQANFFSFVHRFIRPIVFVFAICLFFFFLAGKGSELVEGRIEYGLKHSKDDMRWTFINDSIPIIKDHLFFGSGLGTWSTIYPRYMDKLLTDLEPVFLHSDPLQILTECGMIGITPLVIMLILVSILVYRRLSSLKNRDAVLLSSLYCGLAALLFASIFDFPFRIPAISLICSIYLAFLAYVYETSEVIED